MSRSAQLFVATALGGLLLFAGVPLLTKQPFDPGAFQGRGCSGGLRCYGLVPESAEQLERIPTDPGVGIRHRGLPSSVDLAAYLPPVGSQGAQGSCAAWSTTYYVKTLQEKRARNWSLDAGSNVRDRCTSGSHVFSPAWTYNQLNKGKDAGIPPSSAFFLIVNEGAASCGRMPYSEGNYTNQPDSATRSEAQQYRADSYKTISCAKLDLIKAKLAQGLPIVGSFQITRDMQFLGPGGFWDSFTPPVIGGHAMAVIGYDDNKTSPGGHRGAFKFVNSWGTGYGLDGFGWITYENWYKACSVTYVLYPKERVTDEPGPGPGPKPEPTGSNLKPPARVLATQGTYPDRVAVSWDPVEGAAAYDVQRAQGSGDFESFVVATTNTYNDTEAQPGVAFKYRIVSISEDSRSKAEDSPVAEGYAQAATPTRPGVVTGLRAEAETSGSGVVVNLSWTEAPDATSYHLQRWDSKSQNWGTISRRLTGTSYSDRSAPTGAVIHYAIRAENSSGAGQHAVVEIKVGGGNRPPGVVHGLMASQGTRRSGVQLHWKAAPGATGYYVLRNDPSDPAWALLGRVESNHAFDKDAAARSGRHLYYAIVPYNAAGDGPHTQQVVGYADTGSHRGVRPPPPPQLRVSSRKGGIVALAWQPSAGAAEYYVFRKKESAGKFEFVGSAGNKLAYSTQLPESGAVYFYTVTAKSALGGESARAPAVAVVENGARPSVRRRVIPGQGMERLAGTWKATYLSTTAVTNLVLEVGPGGQGFVARLSADGKARGMAGGKYAMDSRSLSTVGFTMGLEADNVAVVRIDDRGLFPELLSLVFVREAAR